VRRVHQHHVGLGQVGHHPLARHLQLPGADLALDVRVAFGALVLLLDLLLGHLELLVDPPARHAVVGDREDQPGERGRPDDVHQRAADRGDEHLDRHRRGPQ
jgi:hypothetical protein